MPRLATQIIFMAIIFSALCSNSRLKPIDPANKNVRRGLNSRRDIFRPINEIRLTDSDHSHSFLKRIQLNIVDWAKGIKSQIKKIFGIKDKFAVNNSQLNHKDKLVCKIQNSHTVVRPINSFNENNKIGSSQHREKNTIHPRDIGSDALELTSDDGIFNHLEFMKNALQPAEQKNKKRERKHNNIIFQKFGFAKHINIKELKEVAIAEPDHIMTRNERRLANMNPDELTTPIMINWEIGILKRQLEKRGTGLNFNFIKQILVKVNSILQMYIRISNDEETIIKIPAGKRCGFHFEKDTQFNSHLIMLTRMFTPKMKEKSIIARSIYCKKNLKNRAIIGVIEINEEKIINMNASNTKYKDFLMTIVHETMHTLAFHDDEDMLLRKRKINPKHKHLSIVKKMSTQVYDNGHWMEEYLPDDLMVKYSKSNSVISIFSLELLEHQSSTYHGQRKNLVANSLSSNFENFETFMNYQCIDDEPPGYDAFCSKAEAEGDFKGCSSDYVFQTMCSSQKSLNNCYKKNVVSAGNCMDQIIQPNYKLFGFEHRGSDSRCFVNEMEKSSYCLKYEIIDKRLFIVIAGNRYECRESDEIIRVSYAFDKLQNYNLKIKCPHKEDFMAEERKTFCPDDCNQNGFCSNGKCVCFSGFTAETNCKTSLKTSFDSQIFSENIRIDSKGSS
jgi:hypothetical protein